MIAENLDLLCSQKYWRLGRGRPARAAELNSRAQDFVSVCQKGLRTAMHIATDADARVSRPEHLRSSGDLS